MTLGLLLLAALAGGGANALAGGGMFLVFPALLLAGVASVMVPVAFASTWVYRHALDGLNSTLLTRLLMVSLAASAPGSVCLRLSLTAYFFLRP